MDLVLMIKLTSITNTTKEPRKYSKDPCFLAVSPGLRGVLAAVAKQNVTESQNLP